MLSLVGQGRSDIYLRFLSDDTLEGILRLCSPSDLSMQSGDDQTGDRESSLSLIILDVFPAIPSPPTMRADVGKDGLDSSLPVR